MQSHTARTASLLSVQAFSQRAYTNSNSYEIQQRNKNLDLVQTVNFSRYAANSFKPIASSSSDQGLSRTQELIYDCNIRGINYNDPSFGPGLLVDGEHRKAAFNTDPKFQAIEWARTPDILGAEDFCIFNQISPNEIRQGLLEDTYLLCAFSILAEQPGLIRRLFAETEPNKFGVYSIYFFLQGQWCEVQIDDYIPIVQVNKQGVEFAFSRSSQDELWVTLLEKAYAKAYGGYPSIEAGDTIAALRDLTGAPFTTYSNLESIDYFWTSLISAFDKGQLLCCRSKSSQHSYGVTSDMCYSIIGYCQVVDSQGINCRLVKVRMPWGEQSWNGKWGDQDPDWTSENLEKADYMPGMDGTYCFSLTDFAHIFQVVYAFAIDPMASCSSLLVSCEADFQRSAVLIEVPTSGSYVLSIDQLDRRLLPTTQYTPIRAILSQLEGERYELVDATVSNERSIFFKNTLQASKYVLFLDTYWTSVNTSHLAISVLGPSKVALKHPIISVDLFNHLQMQLLKRLAETYPVYFEKQQTFSVAHPLGELIFSKYVAQDCKLGLLFQLWKQEKGSLAVKRVFRVSSSLGAEVIGAETSEDLSSMIIPAGGQGLIVIKLDPRFGAFDIHLQELECLILDKSHTHSNYLQQLREQFENTPIEFMSTSQRNSQMPLQPQNRTALAQEFTSRKLGTGLAEASHPQEREGQCSNCSLI